MSSSFIGTSANSYLQHFYNPFASIRNILYEIYDETYQAYLHSESDIPLFCYCLATTVLCLIILYLYFALFKQFVVQVCRRNDFIQNNLLGLNPMCSPFCLACYNIMFLCTFGNINAMFSNEMSFEPQEDCSMYKFVEDMLFALILMADVICFIPLLGICILFSNASVIFRYLTEIKWLKLFKRNPKLL